MTEVFISAQANRTNDEVGGEDAIFNEDPIGPPILGYGICCTQGRRSTNEDRVVAKSRLNGKPELAFYGVYDGHAGQRAADFCKKEFPDRISEAMSPIPAPEAMQAIISNVVVKADQTFCEEAKEKNWIDGCTACSLLIVGQTLYTINTGDSKSILCRLGKPVTLTEEHKPGSPDEKARIEAGGGKVEQVDGVWRACGAISTSRAVGDLPLKAVIIANPDVNCRRLRRGDDFLVVATDGLWDYVSTMQACTVVCQANNARQAAALLVDCALHNGGLDNVGVVVVDLRNLFSTTVDARPMARIPFNMPQKVKAMADAAVEGHDFTVVPPEVSGWLIKETRGGSLLGKRWQRRYFMLHATSKDLQTDTSLHRRVHSMVYILHYHDSEEAAKRTNPRKPTFVDPALGASRETHFDRPGLACFSLFEMSTGLPFILAATEESDADAWVTNLNQVFCRHGILSINPSVPPSPASPAAPIAPILPIPSMGPAENRTSDLLAGGLPVGAERTLLIRQATRTLSGMAAEDPNKLAAGSPLDDAADQAAGMPSGQVKVGMDGSLWASGPLQLKRSNTGGLCAIGGNWHADSAALAEMDLHSTVGFPKVGERLSAEQCRKLGVPPGSVLVG